MISAILGTLHQFLNYGQLSERHNQASSCYASLCLDIEKDLSLEPLYREDVSVVLNHVYTELTNLSKNCPYISTPLRKRFVKDTPDAIIMIGITPMNLCPNVASARPQESFSSSSSSSETKSETTQDPSVVITVGTDNENENTRYMLPLERKFEIKRSRVSMPPSKLGSKYNANIAYQLNRTD